MKISDKVRLIRKVMQVNQSELAQLVGLSQRDVSLLENGKREFLPNQLIHFLFDNGVDLNWFFNENDSREIRFFQPRLVGTEQVTQLINNDLLSFNQKGRKGLKLQEQYKILVVQASDFSEYKVHYHQQNFLDKLNYLYFSGYEHGTHQLRVFQVPKSEAPMSFKSMDYLLCEGLNPHDANFHPLQWYITLSKAGLELKRLKSYDQKELAFFPKNNLQEESISSITDLRECWRVRGALCLQIEGEGNNLYSELLTVKEKLENLMKSMPSSGSLA